MSFELVCDKILKIELTEQRDVIILMSVLCFHIPSQKDGIIVP